jgi:hypothetical protein
MSRSEWSALYREAWRDFYAPASMRRRLAHAPPAQRVSLAQVYLWYRAATAVEAFHPMMTGFVRLKPRIDRRPGTVVDSRARHFRRRTRELAHMTAGYARVLGELQAAWRETAAVAPPGRVAAWAAFLRSMFLAEAPVRT